MSERITVEVDGPTAAYLRRCSRRGDLAGAAAAALHELAVRDAAESMASWYAARPDYAEDSVEETERALAEAS